VLSLFQTADKEAIMIAYTSLVLCAWPAYKKPKTHRPFDYSTRSTNLSTHSTSCVVSNQVEFENKPKAAEHSADKRSNIKVPCNSMKCQQHPLLRRRLHKKN